MIIYKELKKGKYKNKTIADLGCGEAFLARNLRDRKIHSFDLIKLNEFITQCDVKNVPLEDNCIDTAIFCLSLMGTNFLDFIKEAKRILKNEGILIVIEITSRIVSVDNFISVFNNLGFELRKQHNIKGFFELFVFRLINKVKDNTTTDSNSTLKPCLYKKR